MKLFIHSQTFIPHFTGHVISYPCWDLSQFKLVKGVLAVDLDTLRPEKNGWHFANYFLKCIFLRKKTSVFWFEFHWSLFLGVRLVNGLMLSRQQAIVWSNDDPIHWHIYALPGFTELNQLLNAWLWYLLYIGNGDTKPCELSNSFDGIFFWDMDWNSSA